MALDDLFDPEVGIAVAATAVVLSPQVRQAVRRGTVVALAGALKAGQAVSEVSQSVTHSVVDGAHAMASQTTTPTAPSGEPNAHAGTAADQATGEQSATVATGRRSRTRKQDDQP